MAKRNRRIAKVKTASANKGQQTQKANHARMLANDSKHYDNMPPWANDKRTMREANRRGEMSSHWKKIRHLGKHITKR